jgi:hypothetical protein
MQEQLTAMAIDHWIVDSGKQGQRQLLLSD